jgi:hypothetical protein
MVARTDDDFEDRFRRHFPRRSNDLTLIVLKGHLLMEEAVNRMLASFLLKPQAIEGAHLRFHQKLCLLRALAPVGAEGTVFRLFEAAEKLNILRNRLAHHVDHPQVEARAKDFLSLLEEPGAEAEFELEPLARRLRRAITFACAGIEGVCEGIKAVRSTRQTT